MAEILNWPVEWTALHGIGEIRTPILRACFATDATADKLTVQWEGTRYPEEGATGIAFPYRKPETDAQPMKFLKPSIGRISSRESNLKEEVIPTVAQRNGFSSVERMEQAHTVILNFLRDLSPLKPWGTVVDLGCGDGTLLTRIPATQRIGVNASTVIPVSGFQYVGATIRVWLATVRIPVDLYLIALERFEEDPGLREVLKGCPVLVYSYAPDGFNTRCVALGIGVSGVDDFVDDPACSAVFVTAFDYTRL
jgi:hypothetical protein